MDKRFQFACYAWLYGFNVLFPSTDAFTDFLVWGIATGTMVMLGFGRTIK